MEGKIREGIKNIETFIPGKIKDIAGHRAEIEKLEEQKQMLEYMLKQGC